MHCVRLSFLFDMRKIFRFILINLLVFGSNYNAFSQKESNIWYFGANAGITFSTNPPTAITDGQMNTKEGCATICDTNGNLLFYTDGITVWNKNHAVMGTGLNGHSSSTQSATIVPEPGSNKIYFIFTTDAAEHWSLNGLQYSEVDISKNGGLGKITKKNIELVKPTSEKLTVARHNNNIDFWAITHGINDSNFYSFLITSGGINNIPVISSVGSLQQNNSTVIGYLKASNDSKYLISAKASNSELELFDFDNLTGKVSNVRQIAKKDVFYSAEFSSLNNKLYVSTLSSIYQYDLLSDDIPNSKKTIYSSTTSPVNALQIGIDEKIYIATGDAYLGVINKPDNDSCNFLKNAIYLGGKQSKNGLPNIVPSLIIKQKKPNASFISSDTVICQGGQVYFSNTTLTANIKQKWLLNGLAFGSSKNINYTFKSAGIYTITLFVYKDTLSDTASILIHVNPIIQTTLDAIICMGDTLKIATHNYYATGTYIDTLTTYLGCDSIITTNIIVNTAKLITLNPIICEGGAFNVGTNNYSKAGIYYDTLISYNGCDSIVNTNLLVRQPKDVFRAPDTTVCFENGIQLQLDGGEASEYLWYPSMETLRYQNVISEGTYSVEIKDSIGCKSSDSIRVIDICGMILFVPNAFAPDGINKVFTVYGLSIKQVELKVYSRWGELIYEGRGGVDTSWNGKCHGDLCPVGAYYYSIRAIGKNGETKDLHGLVHLLR